MATVPDNRNRAIRLGMGHETVKGLGNVPHKSQVGCSTEDSDQGVDNHEWFGDFAGEQKFNTACTIKSPSENSRECKTAHGNSGKDGHPVTICGGKTLNGQFGSSCLTVRNGYLAAENDQSSQGADQDGIREYFKDTEHSLLYRFSGIGTSMGDGSGTKTSLIGENSSGNTLFHTKEQTSHDTTGDCGRMERTFNNGSKYTRNYMKVEKNYTKSQYDIKQCHEWNQFFGHLSRFV